MHRLNRKLKSKKGFTLIEMLVVILIIVILLAIAVPSVIAYREDSQRTADSGAAKLAYTALEAALTNEVIDNTNPTVGGWPWWYRDADGNGTTEEAYLREAFGPGSNSNSYPLGKAASEFLRDTQFKGYVRYGYNMETNSINWVSYHEDVVTSPASTNQNADSSEVMVYDVVNDRTGYLDELMADYTGEYTVAIHGH